MADWRTAMHQAIDEIKEDSALRHLLHDVSIDNQETRDAEEEDGSWPQYPEGAGTIKWNKHTKLFEVTSLHELPGVVRSDLSEHQVEPALEELGITHSDWQ